MNDEIVKHLIYIPLFDNLDTDELKFISNYMQYLEVKANDNVFKEGDVGDYVCFVIEGKLDIMKEAISGKSIKIALLTRGRSIGEMSLIDSYRRSATAKAKTDSKLLTLSKYGFDMILENYPKTGIKILKELARFLSLNLRSTSSRLVDSAVPVEAKVR